VSEPATAQTLRNGSVGRAELGQEPEQGQAKRNGGGGSHDDGARRPPPRGPRDRGYGGGRLPRWVEMLLWGILAALAFAAGLAVGQAIGGRRTPRKAAEAP
jgi:hypothetical protein